MIVRSYEEGDREAVIALWKACGLSRAWNDAGCDIDRKRTVQPELFLVGLEEGTLVATAMAGFEGHRGWVNYLGVDPDHQRHGYGTRMMQAAEEALRRVGAPKVNLQVRSGNDAAVAFYRALGYEIEERVSLGKRLVSDNASNGGSQP